MWTWCPRCKKTTRWTREQGKTVSRWKPDENGEGGEWVYDGGPSYEKISCECSLAFVFVGNRLYDIDIRDY